MRQNKKLYEIAHARTGDKFDTSLIAVLPYDRKDLPLLRDVLTAEYVQEHFESIGEGLVEREDTHYGFIFVIHAALDGGVVAGLRRDKHGKSLSGYMLEINIPIERDNQS